MGETTEPTIAGSTSTGVEGSSDSTGGTGICTDHDPAGSNAGCGDGHAIVWCVDELPDQDLSDLKIAPSGEVVLVGSGDGDDSVQVWDPAGIRSWADQPGSVRSMALCGDGTFVVYGATTEWDGHVGLLRPMLRLYALDGPLLAQWDGEIRDVDPRGRVARHPAGGFVIADYVDQELFVGRHDDALQEVWSAQYGELGTIVAMVVDPEGRIIVGIDLFGSPVSAQIVALGEDGALPFIWKQSYHFGFKLHGLVVEPGAGLFAFGTSQDGDWKGTLDPATGEWITMEVWPADVPDLARVEILGDQATGLVFGGERVNVGNVFVPVVARFGVDGELAWEERLPASDTYHGSLGALGRDANDCSIVAAGEYQAQFGEPRHGWICKLSP